MLGGSSAPVVARLKAEMPLTRDVSQVPSGLREITPKDTLFEASAAELPGGMRSQMASMSAVIWRASISM